MHARHHKGTVYWLPQFARDRAHDWGATLRWYVARRGLEPITDDSDDQHQHSSGREALDVEAAHQRHGRWHLHGNEQIVVDRRQALQLSVRLRDWLGNQEG